MAENNILQASGRQHLMLLYDDEAARKATEISCINDALASDQLCIYASVDVNDRGFAAEVASGIKDYDRHVGEGDLLVVDFMPFYEAAANEDIALFSGLKEQVETILQNRVSLGKSGKALIVADAACHLTKHRQFGECIALESWWQETYIEWARRNLDITIICAHPSYVLQHDSHNQRYISQAHSLTIDLKEFARPVRNGTRIYGQTEAKPLRVLVAEPEPDIQDLYSGYLSSLPVDIVIVQSGKECLEQAQKSEGFDMIIVDSHLEDISGIEIANRIIDERPDQHVVVTTTYDPDTVRARLQSSPFAGYAARILLKPFRFSELLSLIKPAESRLN